MEGLHSPQVKYLSSSKLPILFQAIFSSPFLHEIWHSFPLKKKCKKESSLKWAPWGPLKNGKKNKAWKRGWKGFENNKTQSTSWVGFPWLVWPKRVLGHTKRACMSSKHDETLGKPKMSLKSHCRSKKIPSKGL